MNPLEFLKKAMSKPKAPKVKVSTEYAGEKNPAKPVVEKNQGYLGDSARKVSKRNQALKDAAEGL